MAVCWAVRNASIRDEGGSDCCSELYSVETVGFVIGTPVMADIERFTLSKVAMPKSGRGVSSGVIGGVVVIGPAKGGKVGAGWSEEREKKLLSAPPSAAITPPTLDSSRPPAAMEVRGPEVA